MSGESDDFLDLDLSDLENDAIQSSSSQESSIFDTVEKQKATKASPKKAKKPSRKPVESPSEISQKRVPLHRRHTIKTDKQRKGFVRRVVNDIDDRVEVFKQAGYQVVDDGTSIGETKSLQASTVGSQTSRPVGGGVRGVLMEIPEDLYYADQQDKQTMIDEAERAIHFQGDEDTSSNLYGSVRIDRGEQTGKQSVDINIKR